MSRGRYALTTRLPSTDFVSKETSVLPLDHLLHDLTLVTYLLSAPVFPSLEWDYCFVENTIKKYLIVLYQDVPDTLLTYHW